MICGRDGNFCTEIKSGFSDSHVIGGNDDLVEATRLDTTFPDMPDQRFAGDTVERFSGKSG